MRLPGQRHSPDSGIARVQHLTLGQLLSRRAAMESGRLWQGKPQQPRSQSPDLSEYQAISTRLLNFERLGYTSTSLVEPDVLPAAVTNNSLGIPRSPLTTQPEVTLGRPASNGSHGSVSEPAQQIGVPRRVRHPRPSAMGVTMEESSGAERGGVLQQVPVVGPIYSSALPMR